MTRLAAWALIWTVFVAGFVLFVPGNVNSVGCWRLVDASPECLEQLRALNDHIWWTRTLPMLLFLSSGYVVVGAAIVRNQLRSRRRLG